MHELSEDVGGCMKVSILAPIATSLYARLVTYLLCRERDISVNLVWCEARGRWAACDRNGGVTAAVCCEKWPRKWCWETAASMIAKKGPCLIWHGKASFPALDP